MNLLHRALFSQQQHRQSRHGICPACGLPTLFTFHGPHEDDQDKWWTCGNCGEAVALGELWPLAPVARKPIRAAVPVYTMARF